MPQPANFSLFRSRTFTTLPPSRVRLVPKVRTPNRHANGKAFQNSVSSSGRSDRRYDTGCRTRTQYPVSRRQDSRNAGDEQPQGQPSQAQSTLAPRRYAFALPGQLLAEVTMTEDDLAAMTSFCRSLAHPLAEQCAALILRYLDTSLQDLLSFCMPVLSYVVLRSSTQPDSPPRQRATLPTPPTKFDIFSFTPSTA
ncbi:hypothetical protein BT67DRAFT_93677 [Trichocladium antarcticum]|uniref:Uncharacterized protein n=1 Tax=Trichocladium antarcticum TaxID=1450529 RepID=A0AAN6UGH9_9PEZI|nr:hypothetical protein BT67DRAFT_93677 [Trichocladium antarcticum]